MSELVLELKEGTSSEYIISFLSDLQKEMTQEMKDTLGFSVKFEKDSKITFTLKNKKQGGK